jgi:uncharacterized protein (DUF983 family)
MIDIETLTSTFMPDRCPECGQSADGWERRIAGNPRCYQCEYELEQHVTRITVFVHD